MFDWIMMNEMFHCGVREIYVILGLIKTETNLPYTKYALHYALPVPFVLMAVFSM